MSRFADHVLEILGRRRPPAAGHLGCFPPLRVRRSAPAEVTHRQRKELLPWRTVKVTERRPAIDFAACMRDLADLHFPKAERIRVVLDNLSIHSAGSLYNA